jgi:thiamine-phosphate pyrophosphorylase
VNAHLTIAGAAQALNSRATAHLPALIVMTDTARLANPLDVVAQLPKGAAIILRHYADEDAPARRWAREDLARVLARSCRARGLILLIAGNARLALRIGASGLHLPEWQLRASAGPLRRPRPGFIITAACHSAGALARAAKLGVDAALLAPVFPSASHPGAPTLGALRFSAMVHESAVPVYALGGVNPGTVRRLYASGAIGIAGIGFVSVP